MNPKSAIENSIRTRGLSATASALGTNRMALGSYIAGRAREGTVMLLESRVARLDPAASPRPAA